MRVLVTGSRHWQDVLWLRVVLTRIRQEHPETMELAHGKSRGKGADFFAAQWAQFNGVPEHPYPVDPEIDGHHRGAPMARNIRMLKDFKPDLVIAFRAEGKSNGTDHCVDNARKLGYPVRIVNERKQA